MIRHSIAILFLLATASACTESEEGDGEGSTSEATATDEGSTAADEGSTAAADESTAAADESTGTPEIDVPTGQAELSPWLAAESYVDWAAESAVHAPTGTSPHGMVRTFFNDALVASFDASNTEHPVGSASVKELYDDAGTRTGWAVMVKTAAGTDAASWYWYLENSGSVNADGNGVELCEGCHSPGVDRVLTPYPLQ